MSGISHSKITKTKVRLVVVEIDQYDRLQGESASKANAYRPGYDSHILIFPRIMIILSLWYNS